LHRCILKHSNEEKREFHKWFYYIYFMLKAIEGSFFDWTQNFEGNWNEKFVGWNGNQPDCGQFNYEFWCKKFDKPTPQKINWKILNRISILIWKLYNIFGTLSTDLDPSKIFSIFIWRASSFKHVIYLNIHDNIINNSNHVCA
jgi:hypothetical protein